MLQRQQAVFDFGGVLPSISYNPYSHSRAQHPEDGPPPTAEQIRAELKLIAPYARGVRTYSSTGGVEQVAPIASELGLKVWAGIWLDERTERDGREIQAAIDLARRYTNVSAIVVGNETIKTRSLAEIPEIRVRDSVKDRVETIKLSDVAFDEAALRAEAEKRKRALNQSDSECATIDRLVYGLRWDKVEAVLRVEADKRKRSLTQLSAECPSFEEILDSLKREQIDVALRAEADKRKKAYDEAEADKHKQAQEGARNEKKSFENFLDEIKVEKSVEAQIAILQWV